MFLSSLVVFIAGGLLPLAFAPFGYSFLSICCLSLLFCYWQSKTSAQAFLLGWFFGLGQFGVGVSWIYVSIHDFGGTALVPTLIITGLFVAFMALFPAFVGYFSLQMKRWVKVSRKKRSLLIVIIPALWVFFEWVRGWVFTGFPWLSVGYSQTDSWLAGYAPVGGVYGLTWASVVTAGVVSFMLIALRDRKKWSAVALVGLLLGGVWGLGKGLQGMAWTKPFGAPLNVLLVQGNIAQDLKWLSTMKWPTIERYFTLTEQHAIESDLVIWPETAMPVMYREIKDLLPWYRDSVLKNKPALLTGIPVVNEYTGELHNSMVLFSENPPQFYHKRHLVPFGEYLPWRHLFAWAAHLFPLPEDDFSSGKPGQPPLMLGNYRLSMSICYEDAFGNEMFYGMPAANLLVNVSNDAWFGHSMAAAQHLQMARMRALEFGRPLMRATNTGISAMIDKHGRIYKQVSQFEQAVLQGAVQPATGRTPYMIWGNYGVISLVFFLLVYSLWRSDWRKKTVP